MILPPLSAEDREELRRSASDLSDITEQSRERIEAGFHHAYRVAEEIRQGVRDPLR